MGDEATWAEVEKSAEQYFSHNVVMVGVIASTQSDDALPRVVFPAPIAVPLDDSKLVLNASHFLSTLNMKSGHVRRDVWYAAMFDALRRKRARREASAGGA